VIEALQIPAVPGYYFAGAGGTIGAGGVDEIGALSFWKIDFGPCRKAITPRESDVTINKMADQVVARESAVAAPRGPNAVWLPCPLNAAAISDPFPLWSRTTMIKNKQTTTCTNTVK
jgi:hypothetical protein